mmetsp:Transcript_10702/g.37319  ORF Transcript_10702/g.37319 Transcript_10702/m.37319 type:complete len:205 (-) Transcript_10702:182-796(-)
MARPSTVTLLAICAVAAALVAPAAAAGHLRGRRMGMACDATEAAIASCGPASTCMQDEFVYWCECTISVGVTYFVGIASIALTFVNVGILRSGPMTEKKFRMWILLGCCKMVGGLLCIFALCRGIGIGVVALIFGIIWILRGVAGVRLIKARQTQGLMAGGGPPSTGPAPVAGGYAAPAPGVPVAATYGQPQYGQAPGQTPPAM